MKLLKCLALVIGINKYNSQRWQPLQFAINDADAVAKKLTELKFNVNLCCDIDTKEFTAKKLELFDELSKGYDAFVFYFAGHGTIANASDCLLLSDVPDSQHDTIVKAHSIDVDDFLKDVRNVGNQINIFIIDACRTLFVPNARGGTITGSFGNNTNLPFQSFIAYGSSLGQVTKEIPELGHGAFTYSLL